MATLGLKEMGNSFRKVGKKIFSLPSQRNFPISFKTKVAIAKFIWKMQKKSGIMKSGLDTMPLFFLDNQLIRKLGINLEPTEECGYLEGNIYFLISFNR